MRSDTIVILKIGRPGFEFVLHNAEAFLDLPSSPVYFYDFLGIILKVGAYRVESIVFFFIPDTIFI